MQLTDTHCHLNFNTFDLDREAVIARASQAGVHRMLNPGVDIPTSRQAVDLSEQFPDVYAAVGVHPNDSAAWNEAAIGTLRTMASNAKVVAIGEIGLDYYRDRAPGELQKKVFHCQLELAASLGLPVVIHNRKAGDDILAILKEWRLELVRAGSILADNPGVLHSFSENAEFANKALELNFYIGITGPVTYKNAHELRQLVADVPLDRILIETDAPFLTPHPHRGERNEPIHVRYVAEKIAEIRDLPVNEVVIASARNANRLFKW